MKKIRLYELSEATFDKVAPQLLYKIYDSLEKPIMMLLQNETQIEFMDKLLWSFSSNKFLPHGTEKQDKEFYQNVLITQNTENLNDADIIISNLLPDQDFLEAFTQQVFIFKLAENQKFLDYFHKIKTENNEELELVYFQQDQKGKWHSQE